MAAPNIGEPMLLYISTTHQVVVRCSSSNEMRRDINSHSKNQYTMLAYAVFMASRKLRHYFQECSIAVASEVPLNDIINNRDTTIRIAKWAIEILPFKIIYKPC